MEMTFVAKGAKIVEIETKLKKWLRPSSPKLLRVKLSANSILLI